MAVTTGVGVSEDGDTAAAFSRAAEEAAGSLGGSCDLCAVFAAGTHLLRPGVILDSVHDVLGPAALFGCGAGGVVGGGRELESGPGAVVWAASLPDDATADTHRLAPSAIGEIHSPPTGWETLLLIADPSTFAAEPALAVLEEVEPGRPVVGGLASAAVSGQAVLFIDREVVGSGAVAVALSGVGVIPCVSQGAAPVGPELLITAAEGNLVHELEGARALDRLGSVISSLPPREQALAESGVMLGLSAGGHPEAEGSEYLVRPIIGADSERGLIALADQVEAGQVVRLHVRDGASADQDLRAALRLRSTALGAAGAAGALLFTCNGRGSSMFPEPDHDAKALVDALGVAPGGFFCAGEIGPVAGRNFLHGFTATAAVFPSE